MRSVREQSLVEYVDSLPIVSTHEHHISFDEAAEIDSLEKLFWRGYIAWANTDFKDKATRERFLDVICCNSYFVWYEKALDDLLDIGGEIKLSNWDAISGKIATAFSEPGYFEDVLINKCGYSKAILDAYWEPGSDNGRPDLYAPTFRINSFLFGNSLESKDHNGNNAQVLYGKCEDFDEYLAMIDRVIGEMKARGCVALKSALAYDRALDFKEQSKRAAERVFGKPPSNVAPEELKSFGNYIFDYICGLAAKHGLPLQNHTGLGKLGGSNPLNLIPMIEKHPQTRFVLFHGGYPWTEQIAALAHNYGNVVVDLCWLPAISTSAAERALHSLLEAVQDCSRITWGGDCWIATESYAHSLAARSVVAKVLTDKVSTGYLTESRAKRVAQRIFSENAKEIYGL